MDRKGFLLFIAALAVIAVAVVVASKIDTAGFVPAPGIKEEKIAPPAVKARPSICLVLDDFGYTARNFDALREVGAPVTLAVLPNLPYSGKACAFARANGMDVILHLPMEPENEEASLEKDTVLCGMDDGTVRGILERDLDSVASASGASNHMGSRATRDRRLMRIVMDELKERDMYFLDSMTTQNSVCQQMAREAGLPYARRDVFIDNTLDAGHIRGQMEKLEKIALAHGRALGIGHDRPQTIEVLRETVPEMEKRGIRFVTLSEYVKEGKE